MTKPGVYSLPCSVTLEPFRHPKGMSQFHSGEIEIQQRLDAREDAERVGRIIASEIPRRVASVLATQRLAVAASLGARYRPWASLLTGPAGFIEAVDEHLLRLAVDSSPDDLLVANLGVHADLGILVIDPRTRQRLRFNGRGLLNEEGLFLLASQVYGNCQKYIPKRRIVAESRVAPGSALRSESLDARQRAVVAGADTLFIATWHPEGGADASHRGGRPGFVEVIDERTLEFPDYPGNNMFNTLGNLAGHPWAGLLFVDFVTGDIMQVTGRARLLGDAELAVRIEIEEVRETPGAMPLRFELVEPSAANPVVSRHTPPVVASQGQRAGGLPAE
jgi:predicted pyridoxine 5'-phosphate oxidase superfamily flavin-nucleotide-binding protein